MRLLFEGGFYSRAASIFYFKHSVRFLFEGGFYSRAASIQENTVSRKKMDFKCALWSVKYGTRRANALKFSFYCMIVHISALSGKA